MTATATLDFRAMPDRLHGERERRIQRGRNALSFHVSFLDDYLKGIATNDLVLLGAPTGLGKTDLALSIGAASAQRGKRVHYYALEAEMAELELRTKYALISKRAFELRLPRAHELSYSDWFFGRCEDIVGDLDGWADGVIHDNFRSLNTGYRGTKFDAEDLAKSIIAIHRDTDLIIVDHLHYVDSNENENEHRALGDLVKVIRDVTLAVGKPIICVAHLRKKDPRLKQLIPTVDDFHGSSNITKICTQVITIERADDIEAPKWFLSPTYMAILKDRRGGRPRTVALMNFDTRKKIYTEQYTLGTVSGSKWTEVPLPDVPRWAQNHAPMTSSGPSPQTEMHPNAPNA